MTIANAVREHVVSIRTPQGLHI